MPQSFDYETIVYRLDTMGDTDLLWSVARLHLMCQHRGITTKDLASESSRSYTWVSDIMGGRLRTKVKLDTYRLHVEELEDAITRITDRKGGIPYACCGPWAYTTLCMDLSSAAKYDMGGRLS